MFLWTIGVMAESDAARENKFWSTQNEDLQRRISFSSISFFTDKIHGLMDTFAVAKAAMHKDTGNRRGLTIGCGEMLGEYPVLR